MKKCLIVIDMQNDFIDGALGTKEAPLIIPGIQDKIRTFKENEDIIIFTRDTHGPDYLSTFEGKHLPVEHCILGTRGHQISSDLDTSGSIVLDKPNFGSLALADKVYEINQLEEGLEEIELVGLCTDICVVSNALILKAKLPENLISVDSRACAGVTVDSHEAALTIMRMCQINIK